MTLGPPTPQAGVSTDSTTCADTFTPKTTPSHGGALWRITNWSGRRDSNSRQSAWKAEALPTELHPRHACTLKKSVRENKALGAGSLNRGSGSFAEPGEWAPVGRPLGGDKPPASNNGGHRERHSKSRRRGVPGCEGEQLRLWVRLCHCSRAQVFAWCYRV